MTISGLRRDLLGVASTPIREHASDAFTGKGVTIALLDSGFVPHPDLTEPTNRILAYEDVTGEDVPLDAPPQGFNWHGTMVSTAAAGNGHLSRGIYRSIAPDARVVLVRVATRDLHVPEENVVRGLQWVLKNQERYGIRIVNVSVGACDAPPGRSANRVANQLVREKGVMVVAAAGNSGPQTHCIRPADCPSVLTVGGFTDDGELADFYWSTSLGTAEGVLKPELLALAGRVAAPELPGTNQYDSDESLFHLHAASDERLPALVARLGRKAGLPDDILALSPPEIREIVDGMVRAHELVAPHYKMVDGTSFASAITSSIVAQVLEANPRLTPEMVKNLLICTADRIRNCPRRLQGFGIINPRRAVEVATSCYGSSQPSQFAPPHVEGDALVFHYYETRRLSSVGMSGSFNNWREVYAFEPADEHHWLLRILLPPPGKYVYKFLLTVGAGESPLSVESRWVPDPNNLYVESDGIRGYNSVIHVA